VEFYNHSPGLDFRYIEGGNGRGAFPWRVWPLKVGKKWHFEYGERLASFRLIAVNQEARVSAYEEITVPAGTFKAFRIEHRGTFLVDGVDHGVGNDTYWYAPTIKADVKHIEIRGDEERIVELNRYGREP
jgi:hypothetical protein